MPPGNGPGIAANAAAFASSAFVASGLSITSSKILPAAPFIEIIATAPTFAPTVAPLTVAAAHATPPVAPAYIAKLYPG